MADTPEDPPAPTHDLGGMITFIPDIGRLGFEIDVEFEGDDL